MIPQLVFSILLSVAIFFTAFHLKVEEIGLASNLNETIREARGA
jgi:hypothetical protein